MTVNLLDGGLDFIENERLFRVLWGDIMDVYYNIQGKNGGTMTLYVYKIVSSNGREYFLNSNLTQYPRLSKNIEDELFNGLYERALVSYSSGKSVRFGDNVVIRQGTLTINGHEIDLANIHSVRFELGKIAIKKKGLLSSSINTNIQVIDVPNVNVFKSMIEKLNR